MHRRKLVFNSYLIWFRLLMRQIRLFEQLTNVKTISTL